MGDVFLIRAQFLDFIGDPLATDSPPDQAVRFVPDGLLAIDQESGRIVDFGAYAACAPRYQKAPDLALTDRLILPGFIDAHVHYPQLRIPGAYGGQLFDWWYRWVLPEEIRFEDPTYARAVADDFLDEMLRAGTTTCLAFTTIHPVATEALFDAACRRGMRIVTGLTGLDLLVPERYSISAEAYAFESRRLIQRYHGKDRLLYAVTPRYALGCSHDMLTASRDLLLEFEGLWLNTHLAECPAEVEAGRERFTDHANLTAVFEDYGLLGPRFVGGHGVWLSDDEFRRIARSGAAISHCPSSNLFLGSGLFRTGKALDPSQLVPIALGSDLAGGPGLSLIRVMGDAYRVAMQNQVAWEAVKSSETPAAGAVRHRLDPLQLLYLATLGAAKALHLENWLGNFEPGKEADFVIINPHNGPSLRTCAQHQADQQAHASTPHEALRDRLFRMMMMGDEGAIESTWVGGRPAVIRRVPLSNPGDAASPTDFGQPHDSRTDRP